MIRELSTEDIARSIAELSNVALERVTPETQLTELVTDSIFLVELAIELQDRFDVVFYGEDLDDVRNVGDLIELVRSRA